MASITRILCPVDFSEASRHAVDYAVALAGWYGASVSALHVVDPLSTSVPGLSLSDGSDADAERDRLRAEALAGFEGARRAGISVDALVVGGKPAQQILDQAAALPASLIVMGTHGATGFDHLLLGSVAEKVLRKAPCPVLTVPPRAQTTSRLPFRRLVCAVDFSDWSLTALALARSLAEGSGAAITLVHVIEWPWEEPPPPNLSELPPEQAAALAEYRRYVEQRAMVRLEELAAENPQAGSTLRVVHGRPYTEILRVAADDAADLIVMGVHGRNAVNLALFGSTTNQVVRRATCPVLTLRH